MKWWCSLPPWRSHRAQPLSPSSPPQAAIYLNLDYTAEEAALRLSDLSLMGHYRHRP
jgi:hypothetical protein